MDERMKLTGFARYSPRLNLLAQYAESENPILSISATYLLRDKTARRMGASFEFSFLVILPIVTIAMTGMLYMSTQSAGQYAAMSPMTILSGIATTVLMLMAGVYGLIVLVLPGNALMKREPDGSLFRFIPVKPKEVFRDMLKLQLVSFLLPPVIYSVINAVLRMGMWLSLPGAFGGMSTPYASPWMIAAGLVTAVALSAYITFFSIISSLRYNAAWAAFMEVVGAVVVYQIISSIGSAIFMFKHVYTQPVQNISDDWMNRYLIESTAFQIAVFAVLLMVSILLARKVIKDRVMPGK
jgi:hypothetical protein